MTEADDAAVIEKLNEIAAGLCEGGQFRDIRQTVSDIWNMAVGHTLLTAEQDKPKPSGIVHQASSVTPAKARYGQPIGTPITEENVQQALSYSPPPDPIEQALREITKGLNEQTKAFHEIARILKARK